MDELAHAAGSDPLKFRLAHLKHPRLRAVLEMAVDKFGWAERQQESRGERRPGHGVRHGEGLLRGRLRRGGGRPRARARSRSAAICQVFECGAIQNPAGLLSQVQGCIIMGMGGALSEEIRFNDGKILNPNFVRYQVPRFKDVPELDVHLLNRPDLDSAGGGETPIIAVAPAIANAVFQATGVRLRSMPLHASELRQT